MKARFTGCAALSGVRGSLAGGSLLQAGLHSETGRMEGMAFASLTEKAPGDITATYPTRAVGWSSHGYLEPLRKFLVHIACGQVINITDTARVPPFTHAHINRATSTAMVGGLRWSSQ